MKPEKTTLVLRERTWEYVEDKQKDSYGTCDPQQRRICIDERLRGKAKASAQVHELLHALLPDYSEDAVLRLERELVNALCELGTKFKKGWVRDQ